MNARILPESHRFHRQRTRRRRRRSQVHPVPSHRARRALLEVLERRYLLAIGGSIPTLLDTSSADQMLLATDDTQLELPAAIAVDPARRLHRFAVEHGAGPRPYTFDLIPFGTTDGALAVYDADGNLLQVADNDAVPNLPGQEQLVIDLASEKEYVLAVFSDPGQPAIDYQLQIQVAPQIDNSPIILDPATGAASHAANSGEDLFEAPTDVDYYPLVLRNGGPVANVEVTPVSLNVDPFVTVFRRTDSQSPWLPVASGRAAVPGDSVMLDAEAPPDGNVTDAEYLIAVAPGGLNTAGGAYQIDVTTSLLGPAAVTPPAGTSVTPPVVDVGMTQLAHAANLPLSGEELVSFRAPSDGMATVTLTPDPNSFDPIVSVYDESGTTLVHAASRTSSLPFHFEMPVAEGAGYVVRVADVNGDEGGPFTLRVDMAYVPVDVPFPQAQLDLGSMTPGPAQGAQFRRLHTAPDTDVLVVQVAPSNPAGLAPIAPVVTVVGPDLTPVSATAAAGQTLFFPIDVAGLAGPVDLMVSATQGSDPVDVHVGQLAVPTDLQLDLLPGTSMDLLGDITANQTTGAFGTLSGIAFYNHVTESQQNPDTTLTVTGLDAMPLMALFEEVGGELTRVAWALPDASGSASLVQTLANNRPHAVAAIPLSLQANAPISITVDGPLQTGVGVGMVPDPPPVFPGEGFNGADVVANDENTEFQSQLRIRDVVLENEFQHHLWRTLLPANMLEEANNPLVITLTPENQLGVTVDVIQPDGTATGNILGTLTTVGTPNTLEIQIPPVAQLQGQPLLFRVSAIPGQLDDGIYTLEMFVRTENPHPFEVIEDYWVFGLANTVSRLVDPFSVPFADPGYQATPEHFVGGVTNILQNQYGYGAAEASMTSSEPFNPGSVDVFRFRAVGEGPITVRTVPIQPDLEPGAPLDPSLPIVNTNIRLYRRMIRNGVTFLGPLTVPVINSDPSSILPNFDWFPANRSEIDAQTVIRNRDDLVDTPDADWIFPDDEWYYAVVKNQEGTTGDYRIEVESQPYPIVDTARIALRSSTPDTVTLTGLSSETESVRYAAIQVSEHHGQNLQVTSTPGHGLWDLHVFDVDGNRLVANSVQHDVANSMSSAEFPLAAGPQVLYLRAKERALNSAASTSLTVRTIHVRPHNTAPPPQVLDAGSPKRLEVNPFGDGSSNDALVAGAVQQYFFQAGSGPLSVVVHPDANAGPDLRWGVYVDGQLVAWDQTRRNVDGELIPESLWTQLLLPGLAPNNFARRPDCILPAIPDTAPPCADPDDPHPTDFARRIHRDFEYDAATDRQVIIRVEGVNAADAGNFSIRVESAGDKPLREAELTINPLDGSKSLLTSPGVITTENDGPNTPIVTGRKWVRLAVPSGTIAPVTLELTRPTFEFGATPVEYRVYSLEGELLAGGSSVIPSPSNNQLGKAVINLPAAVSGGNAYYVQVNRTGNPDGSLLLRAKTTFGNKSGNSQPPLVKGVPNTGGFPHLMTFDPAGDTVTTVVAPANTTEMAFSAFWVAAAGPVTVEAAFQGAFNPELALYRGRVKHPEPGAQVDLVLLDFVNVPDNGVFQFTANLDPGLYALRARRAPGFTPQGQVTLTVDTTDPTPEEIVLDPNFGLSTLPGLRFSDHASSTATTFEGSNLIEAYRRSQFRVVAPPGSIAGMMAFAEATSLGKQQALNLNEDNIALLRSWRGTTGNYSVYATGPQPVVNPIVDPGDPTKILLHDAQVGPSDKAIPGEPFTIILDRRGLATTIEVSAEIQVPTSGTPDLVVLPIGLTPNDGTTRVSVKVVNVGYAPSSQTAAFYRQRDTSKPAFPVNLQWTQSEKVLPILGPFGSIVSVITWDPVEPADQVEYRADVDPNDPSKLEGQVEELNENNNQQKRTLNEVNKHRPVLTLFALADPTFDGTGTNDDVWGRYVADVGGTRADYRTIAVDFDGPDQLYQTFVIHPDGSGTLPGIFTIPLGPEMVNEYGVDFWKLHPTSGSHPNQFVAYALDRWGLESDRLVRTALVVPRPKWPTTIAFDKPNRQYQLTFDEAVVDYNESTNALFGTSGIPFIGHKKNRLLVDVDGATTASLNPAEPVPIDVSTHVLLKVLEQTIFDQTYHPQVPSTSQITAQTNINIDPATLDANTFTVGVKIVDLGILSIASPEIPLFTFGVPGLAEISANLKVGLNANMNAGLTVAFDPVQLDTLGVARPTFVGMDITPFISIIGEAEVLGFLDIASLEVSVGLEISIDVGLTAPLNPNDPVPFDQIPSNIGVEVGGALIIEAAAEILEVEVWSDDWTIPFGSAGPNVLTWDDVDPLINPLPPSSSEPSGDESTPIAPLSNNPFPIAPTKTGSSLVGPVGVSPFPQLVIDGPGGEAHFVQIADPGNGRGNLYTARRSGGVWGPLTQIVQPDHILDPALVLTHDPDGPPAVLVYQASGLADLSNATMDQFFNSQEIRWRGFDGTQWGPEQVLEANGLFDGHPSMAFNAAGQGAVAWGHNTSSSPLTSPQSNEIMVSLWDAASNVFLPPTLLTSDAAASDARPEVHVADDGTITVVWLRNPDAATTLSATGKEVWFSQYTGGVWSAPAMLPIGGLPDLTTRGRIMQVEIGSSGSDGVGNERLDVVVAYTKPGADVDLDGLPDGPVESKLVHRSAWSHAFAAPDAAVQIISTDANYSGLELLPNPNGGLLAYWQQGDGRANDVYAAGLTPPGAGGNVWTTPTRLSDSPLHETSPTLAFDVDAANRPVMQVLYHQRQPLGQPPAPPPAPGSDGIPLFDGNVNAGRLRMLPELGFSRPLTIPGVKLAPAGSEVTGEATILNRGLAGTHVKVDYFRDTAGSVEQLHTQTIFLGPGRTYDLLFDYPVQDQPQTFGVRVSALDTRGVEMVTVEDNVSLASVIGATDLVLTDLQINDPSPIAGHPVKLTATVHNVSAVDVTDPFEVGLWLGDPSAPLGSGQLLGTKVVSGLPRQTSQQVVFDTTLPSDGGRLTYTAVADNAHKITEAIEFNNARRLNLNLQADPAVDTIRTALVNHSGMDNVTVSAIVRNLGEVDLQNVKTQLHWSRDNGPFQLVEEQILPALPVGSGAIPVNFLADGWAGNNSYRVSVVGVEPDKVPTNNAMVANLAIQGFADLVVSEIIPSSVQPQHGEAFHVLAKIENLGIDDARHVRVEVFAESRLNGRRLVGRTFLDHLPPLSAALAQIDLDTSQLIGPISLIVEVDRLDKILEWSEGNNTAAIAVNFASDCNVVRNQNTLIITGTESDDQIRIAETASSVQLTCGSRPTLELFGIDSIQLNTLGGHDTVDIALQRLRAFTAELGTGHDELTFSHLAALSGKALARILTDAGEDTVDIQLPPPGAAAGLDLRVDLGDDADHLTLRNAALRGGSTTNRVRRPDARVVHEARIRGGASSDVILVNYIGRLDANLILDLRADDGNDLIDAYLALDGTGAGNLTILADSGNGNDQLMVAVADSTPSSGDREQPPRGLESDENFQDRLLVVQFTGRQGDDHASFDYDSHAFSRIMVDADLKQGHDSLTAIVKPAEFRPAEFHLIANLGPGDDTFMGDFKPAEFRPAEFLLAVDMGRDNDTFTAEFTPAEFRPAEFRMFAIMGTGNDVFTGDFKPAQFRPAEFLLGVDMGRGDDIFTVDFKPAEFRPAEFRMNATAGPGNDDFLILFRPAEFRPAEFLMNVDMGPGNDTLTAEFKPAEFLTADTALRHDPSHVGIVVRLGDGINKLDMVVSDLMLDVFHVTILGGPQADQLTLTYEDISVSGQLTQQVDVADGTNSVDVEWHNVSVFGTANTNLIGGAHVDTFNVQASGGSVGPDGVLSFRQRGRRGNDKLTVALVDLLLEGELDLLLAGGKDHDFVSASIHLLDESHGLFRGEVRGDDGDDELIFDLLAMDQVLIGKALADGGAGFDTCRTTRNVRVINCER